MAGHRDTVSPDGAHIGFMLLQIQKTVVAVIGMLASILLVLIAILIVLVRSA